MDRKWVYTLIGTGVVLLAMSTRMPARMFATLLIAYIALCYGLYWWVNRPVNRTPRRPKPPPLRVVENPHAEELEAIAGLPLSEAQTRAETLLRESIHWRRVEGVPDESARIRSLSPSLRSLFERFDRIEATFGDAQIGRQDLKSFKWPSNALLPFGDEAGARGRSFLRIGTDFDDNPLVVEPGRDRLYVVHGTRSSVDKWWAADYPSLFHWFLMAEVRFRT